MSGAPGRAKTSVEGGAPLTRTLLKIRRVGRKGSLPVRRAQRNVKINHLCTCKRRAEKKRGLGLRKEGVTWPPSFKGSELSVKRKGDFSCKSSMTKERGRKDLTRRQHDWGPVYHGQEERPGQLKKKGKNP